MIALDPLAIEIQIYLTKMEETSMESRFKLERLKIAIKRNNILEVATICAIMAPNSADKEALRLSIQTKNPWILSAVASKTPERIFDKSILTETIQTKNEQLVQTILQKTLKKHVDKEILHEAIQSKNYKTLYVLGHKSDWRNFDQEILQHALKSSNPDIVRATVDHIIDKDIFISFKDQIQSAILNQEDIKNLVAQILSRESNQSFDREMQELVVDMYMDVIVDHFKKGDLPKNFPIHTFENSIAQSRYFFSYPDAINFDTLQDENRFLLLPIYAYGHAFSAVVKQLADTDKISITFVNLGARPFEKFREGNQYTEYIYNKEDALKVLKDHSYNVRLYYPARAVSVEGAYNSFAAKAKEMYFVNVTSRDQKVGNCFLKNIEKGLRYALALGITKAENPHFSSENLRHKRSDKQKLKVKFLKPIHRPNEKTNDLSTLELREELVKSLLKRFPQFRNDITREWMIYKARKQRTANFQPLLPEPRRMKTLDESPVFEGARTNDEFIQKMQSFALQTKQTKNASKQFEIQFR